MRDIVDFKRAMRRQNFDEARLLLERLPNDLPQDVSESVGLLHMIQARWQEAAGVLASLEGLTEDMSALARYARNMAALQTHRPRLFEAVAALPESGLYEMVREGLPRPTLCRAGTTQLVIAEDSARIEQAAVEAMAKDEAASDRPVSVLLLGMGDGYALKALFDRPPNNGFGALATLHVMEPDLELFKAGLLLHDWSGAEGPIASRRVVLCAGAGWCDQWSDRLSREPGCPLPTQVLRLGLVEDAALASVQAVIDGINQDTAAAMQRIEAHYQALTDGQTAVALSGGAGRSPRILWLTSRFSNVVKYSSADAVDGFEDIGVRAKLLIEAEDHHQITSRFLVQAVDGFRPDAMMMINYLRSQFLNGLPKSLPVFSWLQDEVGDLMSSETGHTVDRRQFIGSCSPGFYAQQFGYPPRQMMYLDKLTRFPPESGRVSQEPVVVFVSNAARTEQKLLDDLLSRCGPDTTTRKVLTSCCHWLFDRYKAGGCCYVPKELFPAIDEAVSSQGLELLPEAERRRLAMLVFNAVNNTLYRQQALRWVKCAAQTLGLTLELYGQDWDKNPEFKEHNCGYAAYGADLERITQRALFNLQIVPFNCVHQRLLDGWAAGGFYLIRDHPSDRLNEDWQRLFEQRPKGVMDTKAWRAALPEQDRAALDRAIAAREALMMDAGGDVLEQSRTICTDGYVPGASLPPMLADVRFGDEASLLERMRHFMDNPEEKSRVLTEQRASLKLKGLRYSDGMRRVLDKMVREMAV